MAKELKPNHEQIIAALLAGQTQREAARAAGGGEDNRDLINSGASSDSFVAGI